MARSSAAILLSAWLAAAPAAAAVAGRSQVRTGPAAVTGLPSAATLGAPASGPAIGSLQAPGLVSGICVAAPPSISVSAAAGPISLSVPMAAAAVPGLAAPIVRPAPEAKPAEALSSERREQYQSLSSELAVGPSAIATERSKDLAARFFETSGTAAAPAEGADLGPAADAVSATLSAAAPDQPHARTQAAALQRQPYQPETGPFAALKDRYFHARLLTGHLYWYTVTHIQDLWPAYQEKTRKLAAQGEASAVTRPRTFFSHMRVMGETGVFYVLGFAALNDQAVLEESRRTFDRFFDGPGIGPAERRACERFLDRIALFNQAHRAHSNMKKHIRDALLAASVMPARDIAPFFDSLALKDKADQIEEFQRQGAAEIIKTYRQVVLETLTEEPKTSDRVLGVVLLGSFARGAATPTSDMDTELIVRDGAEGRVQGFNERLVAKWEALGLQADNPITPHEHPLHPSKRLLSIVHVDGDILVFSDDAALEDALSPEPGEPPAFTTVRDRTLSGRLGRLFEYAAVYTITLWTDLKRALGR